MTAPSLLDELEGIVRLADKATPGEWRTLYRKCVSPHQDFPDYAQEVFDEAGATIAQLAWHAVQINATTMATDREPNAKLIASAVNFIRAHHAEIADMAKRLEAAERDAARYRWLRDESLGQWEHPICVSQERSPLGMRYVGPLIGDSLDAAIDAATQESTT